MNGIKYLINVYAILVIFLLECLAIQKNIDGRTLAISFFIIGLLTPSEWVILKFIKILKGEKNGNLQK
jgi:hypothetical protein